ncbi:MAG: hypothetical protein HY040_18970, partial [Planctomycetes bacterium]|nr:hypothetical protein [Planctomycetota bacterium]
PERLGVATLWVAIALVLCTLVVAASGEVVCYTSSDAPIEVFERRSPAGDLVDEFLGTIRKDHPFKRSFFKATKKLVLAFKSTDYLTKTEEIDLRAGLFEREKHVQIELFGKPDFQVNELEVDSESLENADLKQSLPYGIDYPVCKVVRFSVSCLSPTPYTLRGVSFKIEKSRLGDFGFPYCGEADGVGASVIRGSVCLGRKDRARVDSLDPVRVGKGDGAAQYEIRAFGEPSTLYKVRLNMKWEDFEQKPQDFSPHVNDATKALEIPCFGEWKSRVAQASVLRILYNCQVDKLINRLRQVNKSARVSILIADDRAPAFFADPLSPKLRPEIAILSSEQLMGLNELIAQTQQTPSRLCSCLILDEATVLLQDPKQLDKGLLITEKSRVAAIAREFDVLSKQVGLKSLAW